MIGCLTGKPYIWKNRCVANLCWGSLPEPQLSWCMPIVFVYIQWELFNPSPLVLNTTLKNKTPYYGRVNTKFENVFMILISSRVLTFICHWWIESTNSLSVFVGLDFECLCKTCLIIILQKSMQILLIIEWIQTLDPLPQKEVNLHESLWI